MGRLSKSQFRRYLNERGALSAYDRAIARERSKLRHASFPQKAWLQASSRGLSLPGSRYTGPFNAMDRGPAASRDDAVATVHDLHYGEIKKKRGWLAAYVGFNEADQEYLDHIKGDTYYGKIGRAAFGLKKRLSWHDINRKKLAQYDSTYYRSKEMPRFGARRMFSRARRPRRLTYRRPAYRRSATRRAWPTRRRVRRY